MAKDKSKIVQAAGTSDGAKTGHATKKTDAAATASQAAHEASATAHESGEDDDHNAAKTAHEAASEAHSAAMIAHAKVGNKEQAEDHAKAMAAHDACADAHCRKDDDAVEAASTDYVGKFVKAGGPGSGPRKGGTDYTKIENFKEQHLKMYPKATDSEVEAAHKNYVSKVGGGKQPSERVGQHADETKEWEKTNPMSKEDHAAHADKNEKLSSDLHAKSFHEQGMVNHGIAKYHQGRSEGMDHETAKSFGQAHVMDRTAKASDLESPVGIVSCEASTVEFDPALPTSKFMWMPAGMHIIQASYDGKPCRLAVDCNPVRDAGVVKASFSRICERSANRPPFGDVNHKEVEAAFWPKDFVSAEDGVYCEAEWTELGLKCVRGKTFRSFSPCFSCDADWVKAVDNGSGVLVFPEGVRGSASNPAKVTGVSPKSVGSLTNWPAFKAILPVKANQAEPQPATKPAEKQHEQNNKMKTKIKFVRASADGKYAAGIVAELEAEDAAPFVQAGEAAEPAHADLLIKTAATEKKLLKSAIVRAVERGALPKAGADGKDHADTEKAIVKAESYLTNGVPVSDVCEIIDGMPAKVAAPAAKSGLFIRASGSSEKLEGQVMVGAETVEETCQGILKAYEPMVGEVNGAKGLVRAGRMDEAITASRNIANLYRSGIIPVLEKGGDFAVKDLVRAADTQDPNGQLGTIATGILLMRDLGYLKAKLIPLDICTTDLSAEPVKFNQQIITRYKTPPNVLTWKKGVGYTASANDTVRTTSTPSTTDVAINMAQNKAVCVQFDNQLLGSTMRNLFGEQQPMEFYALAQAINQHVISTLIAYGWTPKTAGGTALNPPKFNANGWNIPSLVTIKNKMTLAQIPDDAGARKILLHSFFHDILLQDSNLLTAYVIKAALAAQSNPALTNFAQTDLPVLFGLDVTESQLFSDVPYVDSAWSPATFGFAGTKSASLFVSRIPNDYSTALADVPATAAIQVVTEPDSNLSMLFSKWVDNGAKVTNAECALMYQCAGGDPRQGFLLNTVSGAQN